MNIMLETERLLLRQFTLEDTALLLQLNGDPEVLKYLHEPLLETTEKAEDVLRNIILPQYPNGLGRWAIHNKEDRQFIGWCGLKHRPEISEIDLGYRFLQSAWGHGYATEAASHTLRYGFEKLRLDTITGRAHIENIASQKVLEKIGMRYMRDEIVDDCPVKTYEKTLSDFFN